MAQAIWNGIVLAESDATIVVEGNHYFPPTAINRQSFTQNNTHTVCHWKGIASYYDVVVAGKVTGARLGSIRSRKRLRRRSMGTSPFGAA